MNLQDALLKHSLEKNDITTYSVRYPNTVLLYLCKRYLAGDPKVKLNASVDKSLYCIDDLRAEVIKTIENITQKLKTDLEYLLPLREADDATISAETYRGLDSSLWYTSSMMNHIHRRLGESRPTIVFDISDGVYTAHASFFLHTPNDRQNFYSSRYYSYESGYYEGSFGYIQFNVNYDKNKVSADYLTKAEASGLDFSWETGIPYHPYRKYTKFLWGMDKLNKVHRLSTQQLIASQLAYLLPQVFANEYKSLAYATVPMRTVYDIASSVWGPNIETVKDYFRPTITNLIEYVSRGCKRYWEDDVKAAKVELLLNTIASQMIVDVTKYM